MAALAHVGTRTEAPTPPPQELEDDEFSSESDLEEGQDYAAPRAAALAARRPATKRQTPRRREPSTN